MPLKIFGGDDAAPKKKTSFADDVVGRFRSGYQVEGAKGKKSPMALQEWRVTTGDPDVATAVHELLGGEDPQKWDATGEDDLEVFTKADSVEIILEKPDALRQAMVLYGRKGTIYVSDGETILYPDDKKGQPDPQADQTFAERKEAAREGTGAEPRIEVFFRLAESPDLGLFKFQTGSWSLASDLSYNDVEGELADAYADSDGRGVRASLTLEEVSFTAKSGPRAGKEVSYTKPVLKILGPVE